MTPKFGSPTSREIKDQLERMLAAPRFRNASNRADFLALIVRRALQGKKTPGHIIAKQLFQEKPDYYVRVTASNLRKTLNEYQGKEGREDLVRIALPKPPNEKKIKLPEGEAYTPEFSYNPNHALGRELRLGRHFHRRGMLTDEQLAFGHFTKALTMCPHHLEASIGVVEAWCSLLDWGAAIEDQATQATLVQASRVMDMAWVSGSTYWRVYAAAGHLYSLHGHLDRAKEYFAKAVALDRMTTESYEPYVKFLIHSGDRSEGVSLAKNYFDAHEEDIYAYTTYALALARSGSYAEAGLILERALVIDKSNALLQFYVAQLRIFQSRYREALPHLELMKALTDEQTIRQIAPWFMEHISSLPRQVRKDLLLEKPTSG
jgi:tetratricopeptide (TPR) repeat protein